MLSMLLLAAVFGNPLGPPPPKRTACIDDYYTVETIRGLIVEIRPDPEPFQMAEISFSGPAPCERIWMQVLKTDAARCRVGDPVTATGLVTADQENESWEMNSREQGYMIFGPNFTCK